MKSNIIGLGNKLDIQMVNIEQGLICEGWVLSFNTTYSALIWWAACQWGERETRERKKEKALLVKVDKWKVHYYDRK